MYFSISKVSSSSISASSAMNSCSDLSQVGNWDLCQHCLFPGTLLLPHVYVCITSSLNAPSISVLMSVYLYPLQVLSLSLPPCPSVFIYVLVVSVWPIPPLQVVLVQ